MRESVFREIDKSEFIMEQLGNFEWVVKMLEELENRAFVCEDISIFE